MNKRSSIKLSNQDVKHIAKLANLKLTDEEIRRFQLELTTILRYVRLLERLNTSKIKTTSKVTGLFNVTRNDACQPSLPQALALSQTKNKFKNYFKIKSLF